ncbi:MAG: LemA family protein [bacterium]|nr:LemA family protein [bacterium]
MALLLILGIVVLIGVVYYNKIVGLKIRVGEGWSDIQVQLKRRHDLIGNLVETVKGYATHEKETLDKVVQARNTAKQAEGQDSATIQSAERMLSSALSGLKINALAEAYPDLKANTNFLQLQAELADTENKIGASRRFYNTTVRDLNTIIEQFPGNLFKGMAKAEPAKFFELDEDKAKEIQEPPKVSF